MSGHSKWSSIKHKKGLTDQKRGLLFSKLSKLISVAAKGNPDIETNHQLRAAIEKAKKLQMPSSNIEKALNRSSDKNQLELIPLQLEFTAPGNIAVIVEAITDNKNRTVSELRALAQRHNAKMVGKGSLSWMFEKRGVIKVADFFGVQQPSKDATSLSSKRLNEEYVLREELEIRLIEAGAQEMKQLGSDLFVYTKLQDLASIKELIEKELGLVVDTAEIELVASTEVPVPDTRVRNQLEKFFEALDDHDGVETIFSNLKKE